MNSIISVENLSKTYGQIKAIDNISFQVKKGEVVGFLGPNGAGKSTTMKLITGYMSPTEGQILVSGLDVFESPLQVKSKIGYLPETPPLYLEMKVFDYLDYVAQLKGVKNTASHVKEAIEKTNLGDVQNRLIQNLSKGYKQRVGIAQAIVSNPEILILDEPTVGLDPKQVAEIRQLINALKGEHTIIISTHILPEVQSTCEKIIVISKGKIVAQEHLSDLGKLRSGGEKILLKVRQEQLLREALIDITEISHTYKKTPDEGFEISVNGGASTDEALEKVALSVIRIGAGLLEIKKAKINLEEIFLNLTHDDAVHTGEIANG